MNKLFLLALLVGTAACKKNSYTCVSKPITKGLFAGKYSQYGYSIIREPFRTSSHHKIEFYGDSFRLERHNKVTKPVSDSCHSFDFYEFEKGAWVLEDNRLKVKGINTDAQYSVKTAGCYRSGAFEYSYGLANCNDTLILVAPDKSVVLPQSGIKLHKDN